MYIPPSKIVTPTKKAIVDGIFIRKKLNFISSENANPSRIQENVLIRMFFILWLFNEFVFASICVFNDFGDAVVSDLAI